MSRLFAAGLITLALAACKPVAEPVPPAEPAAPAPAVQTAAESAWAAEQDRYLAVNVQPSDPLEAVLWRGVRCDFLGGEFGGDNSEQDRAINARMDELKCGDELLAEARELRGTRAGDPAAVARLDALLARW
ncbi:hypothetical protein [Brevundimonas sp.]|uniref:hypothetical protein n=1 Tax=Brevundimonas sp. TaxID=1871086 RepID=UPI002617F2C4|nr:hypothetical protein [Brevundimonas sp.]